MGVCTHVLFEEVDSRSTRDYPLPSASASSCRVSVDRVRVHSECTLLVMSRKETPEPAKERGKGPPNNRSQFDLNKKTKEKASAPRNGYFCPHPRGARGRPRGTHQNACGGMPRRRPACLPARPHATARGRAARPCAGLIPMPPFPTRPPSSPSPLACGSDEQREWGRRSGVGGRGQARH